MNVKYIRNQVYEYTERLFASNLLHQGRKPEPNYISTFWTKYGGDGKQWPLTPFPFLAPWRSHPATIETPPRPVPAGRLIAWPKNASCFQIPPWAIRASIPPRRWATTSCRLLLLPCTAPLSCSLQPLLECRDWKRIVYLGGSVEQFDNLECFVLFVVCMITVFPNHFFIPRTLSSQIIEICLYILCMYVIFKLSELVLWICWVSSHASHLVTVINSTVHVQQDLFFLGVSQTS